MKYKKWLSCFLIFVLLCPLFGCSKKVSRVIVEGIPILNVGDTFKLSCNIEPSDAANGSLSFLIIDKKIATISDKGLITALAPGKTDVMILPNDEKRKSAGGTKTGKKMTVTVVQPVEGIDKITELMVAVSKTGSIDAKVLPENATDKKLIYLSSDESIAKVSDKGVVTGIKKGGAVITVTAVNGITESCAVTIKQPITGVKPSKTSLEITASETATIKALFLPEDADLNTEASFSSSDKAIATVDENGKIKAVSSGNVTITVTAKDIDGNLLTAKCEVKVVKKEVSSNNSEKNGSNIKPDFGPMPEYRIPLPCSGCLGTGRMLTGVPCYLCDAGKK